MEVTNLQGRVSSISSDGFWITVVDTTGKKYYFGVTSFWSKTPQERLIVDDFVEIIMNNDVPLAIKKDINRRRNMSFGEVITLIKASSTSKFRRSSWVKARYISFADKLLRIYSDDNSRLIGQLTYGNNYAPYAPSDDDIFAEDWEHY